MMIGPLPPRAASDVRTVIGRLFVAGLASVTMTGFHLAAQSPPAAAQPATPSKNPRVVISGPVGPSPYDIVRRWHQPFSEPGFTFGGNSGVVAESPDRILVAQRGEARLPTPLPEGFLGFAGSIGINVLTRTDLRVWKNCLYSLGRDGKVRERWPQWDSLCDGSEGPGPHRLRINPYDRERPLWLVQESFHQIFVLSNDATRLLRTYGEKNVPGNDKTHFAKPQDVAFLPDGRVLIADGLDNHRIVILDKDGRYLSEFGGFGKGPGQFNGVHAVAVGPGGRIYGLDRANGRVNVFKTTGDPANVEFVEEWGGFALPLDIIVNDDALWVADLSPLRFTKLDFSGKHLYTWMVPPDLPDGHLEVHAFSVDSDGNLYAGDNQYGRTQKFVPKTGADRALLVQRPWVARQ